LLVTPSADFFAEPHVEGLIGYAKVLHEAGISWTLSSQASEAANFGLFIGNYNNMQKMALRIKHAAQALNVKRIVFGECGHAWRVAHNFLETLVGPLDFLDSKYRAPQHIVEVTFDLLQRGAIKVNPQANDDKRITFHDSCNIARASSMGGIVGGQLTIPRDVLKAVCNHFYDMPADAIGDATFCCGGGGGLLTDDMMELRLKGAQPRMLALKELHEKYQITHMAAMCAICKSQFAAVFPHYGWQMEQVLSVHQLVGDALVMGSADTQ